MGRVAAVGCAAGAAAAAAALALFLRPRCALPPHLLHHPAVRVDRLLTRGDAAALMALSKEMAEFPTSTDYLRFYQTRHEHVGEEAPMVAGQCTHPFLIPNVNRTACVLAGRIDIGRHFLTHGGVEAMKERYDIGVSRLLSFGRYMFDLRQFPVVERLFAAEGFQTAARRVCPAGRQTLDPLQFNFIIQVPGQSVAMHVDSVYFWGASRFQFPEWLLAAMQFSGLWRDRFVDQVQVVAYYHEWNDTDGRDGSFVYWDENGEPKRAPPAPLSGIAVDGSKTVHAASIYSVASTPPVIDKSKRNALRYVGSERWELWSDDTLLRAYDTAELRMTIVYRARCFADATERERFLSQLHTQDETAEGQLTLSDILAAFRADLRRRGALPSPDPDPLQLAMLIMDTYVRYPLPPHAIVPYNYCILPRLIPALAPVLAPLC